MKKLSVIILFVSIFVGVYSMMPSLGIVYDFIFLMFMMSNVLLVYLVYAVLKFGEDPGLEFNEGYWYSDIDKQYSKDLESL